MDRSKKFLNNKVKPLFGKKSPRIERRPENEIFPPQLGTHPSRPDSPGDGDRRVDIRTARVEHTRRGDNIAVPIASRFNEDRVIGNAENTTADNRLGIQDLERRNMDRQYPNNQRDNSIEKIRKIQDIDPSIPNNRKRDGAAGHDEAYGEFHGPSGLPPMVHFSSESMRFDDTKNSGISVGGGSVSVSNVNSGNTTTVTGTLIQNNTASDRIRPGLILLKERVATSAFHNSARRVDPPRCHPNTRVAIQNQIYDWIMLDLLIRRMWIMWMHGAAGAGKSAIMQSIAELCEKAKIPLASFFFFRTDPTRNSMASFIATIVYQLIQKIPRARDEIFSIIENNPLIFDESLESQLQKLVIQPLLQLQEYIKHCFVIMIDGLDECTERAHQIDLIKLLGTISHSRSIPVVFLVASRREPQIEAAFVRRQILDLVLTLPLDNSDIEQTSDDIRHFLNDKFQDIVETHLRRHLLPTDWPPVSMVEEIVTKSSGQFIYASVVVSYISSPRGNPAHLLEVVHGLRMRELSSQNPFAHLDALYQYIFSQVEELDKVLDILAFTFVTPRERSYIEYAFLLGEGGLEVCFADLIAVIDCGSRSGKMKFLHASLPDFLRDKTRSERYHIDVEEYLPKLLCMFLDRALPRLDPNARGNEWHTSLLQQYFHMSAIRDLLASGAKASGQLHQSIMSFSVTFTKDSFESYLVRYVLEILQYLKQLNFNDKGKAYYHILDQFAINFSKHWSSLSSDDQGQVKNTPDLWARISQTLLLE